MKVSEMSIEELKDLVAAVVEQKLAEILGDPDWGMELKEEVKERLRVTSKAEAEGRRGIPAAEVARKIGIDW
ncbi:MAG: hypothetical protein H8D32_00100 [Dehalococcoidia bacterium]|nr:hypothetical protein [Dehalococcoidia bacterium]